MNLEALEREITHCRRCPRLVEWREQVAREKRASFADQEYWGRPVPGFGDPDARVCLLGLAPAAHGANRTGRMFTGDRSGDWLFAALHACGLANQPTSVSADDGLQLIDCFLTAAVRCAPPSNRPTPAERDNCLPWAKGELELLPRVRVVVCLGGFAWDAALRLRADLGEPVPRPKPRFGHGAELPGERLTLLGCFHPSQQNTFTGRLTVGMMEEVFAHAKELAESEPDRPRHRRNRRPGQRGRTRPRRVPGTRSTSTAATRTAAPSSDDTGAARTAPTSPRCRRWRDLAAESSRARSGWTCSSTTPASAPRCPATAAAREPGRLRAALRGQLPRAVLADRATAAAARALGAGADRQRQLARADADRFRRRDARAELRSDAGVRQSKLAQVMHTFDLAEQLDPDQVTANCLHPATFMPTKIVLHARGSGVSSLEEGAEATERLVLDPDLDAVSGLYFNGLDE